MSQIADADLRKKLKVVFAGEEGVDEGGVAKEFFQLLTVQVSAEYARGITHTRCAELFSLLVLWRTFNHPLLPSSLLSLSSGRDGGFKGVSHFSFPGASMQQVIYIYG